METQLNKKKSAKPIPYAISAYHTKNDASLNPAHVESGNKHHNHNPIHLEIVREIIYSY
jgi:hypothetical protein